MSNLNKLDFIALEVSGRNYLKWTQDVKLHLTANKMRSTINADNIAPEDMKARAMIFIRKHMEEALEVEYLAEEDPRIRSLLKFCGEELTEADLLEKTFSTFPPSCMVLQQQYRERNFARFSELVTVLLLNEKNNDLLLRNDQARPTSTRAVPLPEANVIAHRENNCARRNWGRGRGRRPERPRHGRRNGPRNAPYDRDHQVCILLSILIDHWSRTCRATNEEIGEYYARRGTREANLVEGSVPMDTTLEITDFQAASVYIEDCKLENMDIIGTCAISILLL
ncbi:uncharacterized protein LOC112178194 [Rosa chinensis]|uniref:uncharacterized protein LOC112178194 n=1 Tax=Rosa chinensis TaxID=74649 RepID=UPI000D094331|nr:uncharacterized protein LOC112178194 [Rosa chinensis]